jgi:isopentenyl-diphosphate Delta-isomerase
MELVVLVDENNKQIGVADKENVHTQNTPLHRGFSVFLFNSKKEILLTKRAANKKTFAAVWSNTVCGHPGPNEEVIIAAKRRMKDELGLIINDIKEISPYRYRFADRNGIVENEICPIMIAKSNAYPRPNPEEVEEWKWMLWSAFLDEANDFPDKYSPWCVEEARIVNRYLNKD